MAIKTVYSFTSESGRGRVRLVSRPSTLPFAVIADVEGIFATFDVFDQEQDACARYIDAVNSVADADAIGSAV